MRLKARGLAQHGAPPGWLEESDSCDFVRDGRAFPVALTGDAQLKLKEFPAAVI
jgi:hypothetical protein